MEKCFKVIEGSQYHDECVKYAENRAKIRQMYKVFAAEFGISATEYIPYTNCIYIKPTEDDVSNFDKALKKPNDRGFREFKQNSKQCKWWIEKIMAAEVRDTSKPYVPFWFDLWSGKARTRLFPIDDVWYGSYDTDGEFALPDGLEEMKQSEFYKMIEDYNAKVSA